MPESCELGAARKMNPRNQSWTHMLRQEGPNFLAWVKNQRILSRKFDVLATGLSELLLRSVCTTTKADSVWEAVPAVLERCNERATYDMPGAVYAYAWLHLLDRYVRTWVALERLVEKHCLPMGDYGVRVLDVGTGPGPAAFAIHDFYSAMVEFSTAWGNPMWRQPPDVTCRAIAFSIYWEITASK